MAWLVRMLEVMRNNWIAEMSTKEKGLVGALLYVAAICAVLLCLCLNGCTSGAECLDGQWQGDGVTMNFNSTGAVTFESMATSSDGTVTATFNVSGTWEDTGTGAVSFHWTPLDFPTEDVFTAYDIKDDTLTIAPFSPSVLYVLKRTAHLPR